MRSASFWSEKRTLGTDTLVPLARVDGSMFTHGTVNSVGNRRSCPENIDESVVCMPSTRNTLCELEL